jgi:hypothetical protein
METFRTPSQRGMGRAKGKKQPLKRRRREDDDDSHHLLDNDSGRMEDDADSVPSTSASAAPG